MNIESIVFNGLYYLDILSCHLLFNMCELETVSCNKRKKKSNCKSQTGNGLQRVDDLADVILKLLQ